MRFFKDRKDAGAALGRLLKERYFAKDILIYALPRGGVPVGVVVAKACRAPLDILIIRKIGNPQDPEYAIGAMSEDGETVWNHEERTHMDEWWLSSVVAEEEIEAARRRNVYRKGRGRISAKGKIAVVVDDGAATGLTMRAALKTLRKDVPEELVAALPVAPCDTAELLRKEADTVLICHEVEDQFGSVGRFYDDFAQVSDEEVVASLTSLKE